jgi:hypothetical protein
MSFVIQCGPTRRIVRYAYGWKLEKLRPKGDWKEDSPAYPANLGQALENLAERILADDQEKTIEPKELAAELAHAVAALEDYTARARKIGQELEEDLVND